MFVINEGGNRKAMIVQIRVDDRLVHGQVALVWSKQFGVTHMVVANDAAAKDDIQKMTLKMATPNGIKLLVKSVNDSIALFNDERAASVPMFVLTNSVVDALKIAENCKVQSINVANVGRFSTATKKYKLNSDVVCEPQELEALKKVAKLKGVEAIHQVIPTKPKVPLKKLLEKIEEE